MTISGKELKKQLRIADYSQERAANLLGVSRQTLNQWLNRAEISPEILHNVKTKLGIDFPNNREHTPSNDNQLNQKASNITDTESNNLPAIRPRLEAEPLHLAADPNDYDNDGSRFEELADGTIRMRVPVVPHKAFAGYLRGFQDPEYYEDMAYVSIEVFKQHRGHYLAFEVKGDSMTTLEPEHFRESIFNGVKVVGRELARTQWKYKLHTHSYSSWVIVHKTEGILIKQITRHDVDKGIITIHSLNPDKNEHPDKDLYLDDIEQIFNVVKKIDE